MNTMFTTLGAQAEFTQTWNALQAWLEEVNMLAHRHHPNRTQTLEALSISKHLLDKLGNQIDHAITAD